MTDHPLYTHAPGVAKHPDFAKRLAEAMEMSRIAESDRPAWIASLTATSESQAIGYLRGDFLPPEYRVIAMADALKVSGPWLARGVGPKVAAGIPHHADPLRRAEPLVLRWVEERSARSTPGMDLHARAVPYDAYVELEERHNHLAARLLRAESEALMLPTVDLGARDPNGWGARLSELAQLVAQADIERRDDDAKKALAEAMAIAKAWAVRLV